MAESPGDQPRITRPGDGAEQEPPPRGGSASASCWTTCPRTRRAPSTRPSPSEARRMLRLPELHCVPKHASWLNRVEIEIGVLRSQSLDRRIAAQEQLKSEMPPGSDGATPQAPASNGRSQPTKARALSRAFTPERFYAIGTASGASRLCLHELLDVVMDGGSGQKPKGPRPTKPWPSVQACTQSRQA